MYRRFQVLAIEIEDAPSFGQSIDTGFIMGLGKVKDIIMLDIGAVLSADELEMAGDIANE